MKKRILLISTGGTIGSSVNAGTININSTAQLKLLQLFEQQNTTKDITFDCRQPLQLLSENLVPCVWQILIAAIEAENLTDYQGIIITHGTDTLAYTACALSFYFHQINIPMLLVSSDYPLDDARANGLNNFVCAVEFIRQHNIAGVFVPYQNQGQEMQIHLGSRLTSSLQLSSDFLSIQNKPFMQFIDGQFKMCHAIQTHDFNGALQAQFTARILLIKPYPGLNYQHFKLTGIDAVLHDLYHSGTACETTQWGEQYALSHFLQQCQQQNIPVYLAPALYSDAAYQSTRLLMAQGVTLLWNLSLEAAYVKLLLAYSHFNQPEQIIHFMTTTIANEHI